MKLHLVAVGRVALPYAAAGCGEYLARLRRYGPVEVSEVKGEPGGRGTPAERVAGEAQRILKVCGEGPIWALDPVGEQLSSEGLASALTRLESSGARRLALIIGGPDGLGESILAQAARRWSLSALTLPHDLARLLLLESLYRARTIQRGEPYHR